MRLDAHDSNFSLYRDGDVEYVKTERIHNEKHHSYDNLWEWKPEIERIFNVDADELDGICIVVDSESYGITQPLESEPFEPWPHVDNAECKVFRADHHHAHAYSDWTHIKTDGQVVIDGWGEEFTLDDGTKAFSGISVYKNKNLIERVFYRDNGNFVGSLGLNYSAVANLLDIQSRYDIDKPGKIMSLQSYGNFDEEFYKSYLKDSGLFPENIDNIFSIENWVEYKGSKHLAECHKLDWIKTIQDYISDELVNFFDNYFDRSDTILFSGGVAQNIIWNTQLKKHFPNLIVLPHSADGGLSLGALNMIAHKNGISLETLDNYPFIQKDCCPNAPSDDTISLAADMLANDKIIGWFQGNGPIGPRALGNRCILMNPELENAKDFINKKVKNREGFRPFSGTVLKEHEDQYFDLDFDNPYMLYLAKVEGELPAITHIDGTSRHQTLENENKVYRTLIEKFYEKTGVPVVLNTSLNLGGKPIAGDKISALSVYHETDLDALFYGNDIYRK